MCSKSTTVSDVMSPKFDANYYNSMTKSVYHDYIAQKGYTERECYRPAAKKQFPLNLYGRIFETEEEYNDAIADMLNGM